MEEVGFGMAGMDDNKGRLISTIVASRIAKIWTDSHCGALKKIQILRNLQI
jgi:hypothetical protein